MIFARKLASILLTAAVPAAWTAAPAAAQSYPNRTVQIINPTQAGATTDVLGRALAVGLATGLASSS